MANNNNEQIVVGVDIPKTVSQINSDIKKLQSQLKQIKAAGALDTSSTVKRINTQIATLQSQLQKINIQADIDTNSAQKAGEKIGQTVANSAQKVIDSKNINIDKLNADIKNLTDNLDNLYSKDAKAEPAGYAEKLARDANLSRRDEINGWLDETDNSMHGLKRLGALFKDQMSQAAQSLTQMLSLSSAVMFLVSKAKSAISELKDVNTLLTEIGKADDTLSKSDLAALGNRSFDIASKYGKNAADYLSGVQEASRSGYENAEAIAELSIAAQGAGNMTADLANQYIIATDKAYNLGGSVEKLTEVLDGSNYIADHNAVNMTELAEAMSIAGSTAASFGIEANEATAALGTMIAATQQSGSEMARAFRAILLNIRQITDEEEGIDAEGLARYEKACNALGVSLKETKDGILQTRDAMAVLRDLSVEYNKLGENDLRGAELLNSAGGNLRANALDAILKNYDMYSRMLDEYAQGTGSMSAEAEKAANSWEGSLNRLSNTWTDTIGNIANSDAVITIINSLNSLLSIVNNVTDRLGSLKTIGLGAGLFAGIKNVGKPECGLHVV